MKSILVCARAWEEFVTIFHSLNFKFTIPCKHLSNMIFHPHALASLQYNYMNLRLKQTTGLCNSVG